MSQKTATVFDVICVGSGPTSLFAGLELTKLYPGLRIGIFEAGPPLDKRTKDNLVSGVGGAGAFSDGKLNLPNPDYPDSLNIGGQLASMLGPENFLSLIEYVSQIYSEFGGRPGIYENDEKKIKELVYRASAIVPAGLKVIPTRVRHFGSDLAPTIIGNIARKLESNAVKIYSGSPIKSIKKQKNGFSIRAGGDNTGLFRTKYVIAAPGRVGAGWLASQAPHLGFEVQPRQAGVDIGVRVEVLHSHMQPLTEYLYDSKIEFYPQPFEDKVRTFCTCPFGEVLVELYQGLLTTVNGHSLFEKHLSENTNFAILVSVNFTEPFKEPIKYAVAVSQLANMLSGKVLVQRLGDLRAGRRSKEEKIDRWLVKPTLKEAVPGDISFAIPYRQLTSILKMIEAIDKIAPGVNGDNTLLYGSEVKFYSSRIKTNEELEAIDNFFVGGDGAGVTRGLAQSSASGILIARAIVKRT